MGLLVGLSSLAESSPTSLLGAALQNLSATPTDADVGYELNSSGAERKFEGDGVPYSTIGTWLLSGSASDYECRLTVNSGDAPTSGSSVGVWLSLSTFQAWRLTVTTTGPGKSGNYTVEIRHASTLVVTSSATVTMLVTEEP